MRRAAVVASFALSAVLLAWAQDPGRVRPPGDPDPNLKRKQIDDILESDHKKSVKDAAELIRLAEQLQVEIEKNDKHVLSLSAYKLTEDIEKVAKRMRGRMKRF